MTVPAELSRLPCDFNTVGFNVSVKHVLSCLSVTENDISAAKFG